VQTLTAVPGRLRASSPPYIWKSWLGAPALADFRAFHVIVHNAAPLTLPSGGAMPDITIDQWRGTLAVNLDAAFFLTRALLRREGALPPGSSVVFIGSRGHGPSARHAAYPQRGGDGSAHAARCHRISDCGDRLTLRWSGQKKPHRRRRRGAPPIPFYIVVASREAKLTMTYQATSFQDKLALFTEHWKPKIIGQMNDYHLKLVKVQGSFVWHSHPETDEVFIVINGSMEIEFRDGSVTLRGGEMYVVPRGVEHKPFAAEECSVLLIEPAGTINTGDVGGSMTAPSDDWM
jgi:mannose-6-phosphate isomerase-like protein (cupin superfamily)